MRLIRRAKRQKGLGLYPRSAVEILEGYFSCKVSHLKSVGSQPHTQLTQLGAPQSGKGAYTTPGCENQQGCCLPEERQAPLECHSEQLTLDPVEKGWCGLEPCEKRLEFIALGRELKGHQDPCAESVPHTADATFLGGTLPSVQHQHGGMSHSTLKSGTNDAHCHHSYSTQYQKSQPQQSKKK